MSFYAVIEGIFKEGKDIIITWFSVLARGPNAFERIDLENSVTLIYALRFMFFMVFVDLLVNFPLAAKIDGSLLKELTVPPYLAVEAYAEYLVTGMILYGSMKLVGGKGGLQACMAAYCFLTAYLPLISLAMLPVHRLTVPAMLQGSNYIDAVLQANAEGKQLSTWDLSSIVLSGLLTTIVFVFFFRAVFQHFRKLHQLRRARALLAFIGGLVGSAVIMAMFLEPALSAILRALVR